ncbi:MAG: hypothetical protein IPP40_18205 [bacterium]|nr:hypothetical protein [bacterium]
MKLSLISLALTFSLALPPMSSCKPIRKAKAESQFAVALDTCSTFMNRVTIARQFQRTILPMQAYKFRATDMLMLEDPAQVAACCPRPRQRQPIGTRSIHLRPLLPTVADKQSYVAKILTLNPKAHWGSFPGHSAYSRRQRFHQG